MKQLFFFLTCLLAFTLSAADYFVSPTGKDSKPGSA